MALATVVAGPYTTTFSGSSIGITEDGIMLNASFPEDEITGDAYGDSVIDTVRRGANVFLALVGIEYTAALPMAWPESSTFGRMGVTGRMGEGMSVATVLTSTASTSAAAAPATLTSSKTLLSRDSQTQLQFAARGRKVPVQLRCFPYLTGGNNVWFTVT